MLSSLTARQLIEWEAYAAMEPFGEAREDLRNARVIHMIFNTNVEKKDQKPLKDFLLKFEDDEPAPRKRQDWREQKAIMEAFSVAHAHGAKEV